MFFVGISVSVLLFRLIYRIQRDCSGTKTGPWQMQGEDHLRDMQGQVIEGPVLLLRISAEEYATIQELFAFVPHMDRGIVGYEHPAIDRLAACFAEAPFSAVREKTPAQSLKSRCLSPGTPRP